MISMFGPFEMLVILGFALIGFAIWWTHKHPTSPATADFNKIVAQLQSVLGNAFDTAVTDIRNSIHSQTQTVAVAAAQAATAAAQPIPAAPSSTSASNLATALPAASATEKSAMATLVRPISSASMFAHQAPAPQAIAVLNDFKSYAKACQFFLDLKTEAEKWVFFTETPQLLAFQALFGIGPGWINAFYSGAAMVNGVGIYAYLWDFAGMRMTTRGHQPVIDPVLTWQNGAPPAEYQALAPTAATGADVVAAFLTAAAAGSASLRNLGLTPEAIAAARE